MMMIRASILACVLAAMSAYGEVVYVPPGAALTDTGQAIQVPPGMSPVLLDSGGLSTGTSINFTGVTMSLAPVVGCPEPKNPEPEDDNGSYFTHQHWHHD